MNSVLQENPFSFLKGSVNILLVDDMPEVISGIVGMLELYDLYFVSTAQSSAEASRIIELSEKRYHVCVEDLGMDDINHNEFYLVEKYGRRIPFVVLTARSDTEKGFACGIQGVKETFHKGGPDLFVRLLSAINKYALQSILCPGSHENPPANLMRFMASLQKNPVSVKEWVSSLNMDDSYFRREWEKYSGLEPRFALHFSPILFGFRIHQKHAQDR